MARFSPSETRRILAEHDSFVRAIARSLVRDENDVDDLIQDTWVALLRARPKLGTGLRPWLRRVVRNTALSKRRSKQRRTDREALVARPDERESGVESLSERLELNQQVVACVLELDEAYRAVVLLRYERGLSIEAIAENLSLPVETVRTRLRRARQRLREKLERRIGSDGQNWAAILLPLAGIRATPARDVLLAGIKAVAATAALTAAGMWAGTRLAPAPTFEELGLTAPELERAEDVPRTPRDESTRQLAAAELPASTARVLATDPERGRALRIVKGRNALPVPGASVWSADQTLWQSDPLWIDAAPAERERLVKQRGKRLEADENGIVYLPRAEGWLQVYASAEGLWNHRQVDPSGTVPVELELVRDRTLLVEVVDQDGRPRPGVPVTLGPGWNVLSDAQGLARFEHVDALQRFSPEGHQRLVGFGFPHVDGPAVPIELEDLPEVPVRLVLPPTGGLLIRLLDQDGEPYEQRCHVQVRALGGDSLQGGPFAVRSLSGSASERSFSHIALDCRFAVSIFPSGAPAIRFDQVGPREPGQTVEVLARVRATGRPSSVSGQLVDDARQPLVGRQVLARYEARGAFIKTSTGSSIVETDADGRFELETEAAETVALSFRLPAANGRPAMVAKVETPPGRELRTMDVGQVQMWDLPRVAAGRVVDAAGEPVAGATVRVARASAAVSGPPTKAERIANAGDDGPVRRVRTAGDGSFVIYEELEPGRYALSASQRPRLSSRRHILELVGPRPVEGIELVLHDRLVGSLQGSIALPSGMHASRVLVAIKGGGGTEPGGSIQASRRSCSPAPSGRFRLDQLDAGEATLQVWIEGWRRPALEIEGVQVAAGVVNVDPRLERIELDGLVFPIPLEITDANGTPIAAGEVRHGSVGGALGLVAGFHDGRVRLLSPTSLVDVEIAARGFETLHYPNVGALDRLTLGPGHDFLLRLRAESVIPEDSRLVLNVWAVQGVGREDASPPAPTTTRTVGPDRQVTVTLPHAGTWQLEWQLERSEKLDDAHDHRSARRFVARETVRLTRDHAGRPVVVGPSSEALSH